MDNYLEIEEKIECFESKTPEELENSIRQLIKNATRIIVKDPSQAPGDSHLKSHFGGQPYFEKGEEWPKDRGGYEWNLEFVFQIFNNKNIELPENIKLIQFYCELEDDMPLENDSCFWIVKIYENLDLENAVIIEKPKEHNNVKYCEIEYESIKSLPDWVWQNFDEVADKLMGENSAEIGAKRNQLGGYAQWIQNDESPDEKDFQLLFQIDSEKKAGLSWGDCGKIYVFYDSKNKIFEYILQCY
jgi:uncharacterized protein YwqG